MKITISTFILSLALLYVGCSNPASKDTASNYYLFVGTYTGEGSEGIYLYRFNSEDGSIDSIGATTGIENPSFLALSPDYKHVYSVNQIGDSSRATISSFAFDKETETLQFLNRQSSHGSSPCYVSVDQTGQAVFTGNYAGGSLTMLPVNSDGSLSEEATSIQRNGSSVNKDRQSSPHVHFTKFRD